jgi:hypothetical protein
MRTGPLRRRLVRIERGLSAYRPASRAPSVPDPIITPARAEDALAALLAVHRPGEALTVLDVAAAVGVTRNAAAKIRRYHLNRKRWPFRDKSRRPDGGLEP